ncbi:MAG: methyltransferase domain-containing protein [Candidatus Odinarchaeota archaeon]
MTKVGNRINAWRSVMKIGSASKFTKQFREYWRDIVIVKLKDNFLNFLKQPHKFSEIKERFKVTDDNFLYLLLDTLLSDNTIEKTNNGFLLKKSLDFEVVPPSVQNISLNELIEGMANAIFNRLFHEFHDVSSGFNLFIFDDGLSQKIYKDIRSAAISFVPNSLENPGRFLDLGCGSGTETADFWIQMMEKCKFEPKNGFKLIGVDINDNFIDIAKNEFYDILKKFTDLSEEAYLDLKPYHPEFKKGTSTKIPYPDNYFDYIFTSQVLHWTDLNSTLKEIYRCLKHGGVYFGTNALIPPANPYFNLILHTIEGARGFFTKEEFIRAAKHEGFTDFRFATPITIFRFEK